MKTGDVFDEIAVDDLYHKISADPLLAAYKFSFEPTKDKASTTVDLTLNFYKTTSNKGSVTIR